MADNKINVGGRLHSVATGNILAGADEILDDNIGKKQSEVNIDVDNALANRYTKDETYNKNQLNNLITTPNQKYVTVKDYASLPESGEADTIYRVSNWDGSLTTPATDITKYSEYAWDGSQYIFLCVKSQIGEVYDISAANSGAKYADLSSALGVDGGNVPSEIRRGGMSVKFVQSSDNKYVQYLLISQTWSIEPNNWQKINNKDEIIQLAKETVGASLTSSWSNGEINTSGVINSSQYYKYSDKIVVNEGDVITFKSSGNKMNAISLYNASTNDYIEGVDVNGHKVTDIKYVASQDGYVRICYAKDDMSAPNITIKPKGALSVEIETIKEEIDKTSVSLSKVIKIADLEELKSGYYFNADGTLQPGASGWKISKPISLRKNDTIYIKAWSTNNAIIGIPNDNTYTIFKIVLKGDIRNETASWIATEDCEVCVSYNIDYPQHKREYEVNALDAAYDRLDKYILENAVQVSDGLSLTSGSAPQAGLDVTTGLVGVAYQAAWKEYGETDKEIRLDIFQVTQPTNVRHIIIAKYNSSVGNGIMTGALNEVNCVLISSCKWRVMFPVIGGWAYRDYTYDPNEEQSTLSDANYMKASIGGELVNITNDARVSYLESHGVSAGIHGSIITSSWQKASDGYWYGCWTSPEANPILVKSDDDLETIIPFGVYDRTCQFEASLIKVDETLYLIGRLNNDAAYSNDNGVSWTRYTRTDTGDNRPRLYYYNQNVYWVYNLNARLGRIGVTIKKGANFETAKIIYNLTSQFGCVYPTLVFLNNYIYVMFSDGQMALDDMNGAPTHWRKDCIKYCLIGKAN